MRYLLPLRERLTERLRQLGRWHWFEEEMAQLDAAGSFAVDPEQAWRRFKGIAELDPARQRLARALSAWRERRAISSDRPRNWILPDAALRDIVLRVPRTMAELALIGGTARGHPHQQRRRDAGGDRGGAAAGDAAAAAAGGSGPSRPRPSCCASCRN